MKTVYISDLDGTLLNSDCKLSEETKRGLNKIIESGTAFTFATARSPVSANKIFGEINMNLPCILMNGVLIYDLSTHKYVKSENFCVEAVAGIISEIRKNKLTAFVYELCDNEFMTYYENLEQPQMHEFYQSRVEAYGKRFTKVESIESISKDGIIYFTLLYPHDVLKPVNDAVKKLDGVRTAFYQDIYSNGMWYLEIFSSSANKAEGVRFIREMGGYDRVVSFGDNLNDLPLFEASDVRCAVENAVADIKAKADVIIDSNNDNGVVRYILSQTESE